MDERECYEKLYGDLVDCVPHYEDFYLKRCVRAMQIANELMENLIWRTK